MDLFFGVKRIRAIHPQVVGTSGAAGGVLSPVLDTAGFDRPIVAVINHGTTASAADTNNIILYESDTSTTGDFTSVANADMLSQTAGVAPEAAAGLGAVARTSGTGKNVTRKLGYIGAKRYLRMRIYGLGHATGIVAASWELGEARKAPVATA